MNLGTPELFNSSDSSTNIAYKLNSTLESIWRTFKAIDQVLSIAPVSDEVFGHTSLMPDTGLINTDHDKRYYTKSQIERLTAQRLHDKKTQAVRDGTESWNDEPDVLDIKLRAGAGIVKTVSPPIQFLVPPGVANMAALRELV